MINSTEFCIYQLFSVSIKIHLFLYIDLVPCKFSNFTPLMAICEFYIIISSKNIVLFPSFQSSWPFLVLIYEFGHIILVKSEAQLVNNPPAMQETRFDFWVRKIPWRRDRLPTPVFLGFPGGSGGNEFACNAGDMGLNCIGPFTCRFFSIINTIVPLNPWLVGSMDMEQWLWTNLL